MSDNDIQRQREILILQQIMLEFGLGKSEIAQITHRSESAVGKWLDGTNGLMDDAKNAIIHHLNLPERLFDSDVSGLVNLVPPKPPKGSIYFKWRDQETIMTFPDNAQAFKKLRHLVSDLAVDESEDLSDPDEQT